MTNPLFFVIPNFTFKNGTKLPSVKLAYLDINPTAPKTALISTCFKGRLNTTLTFANGAFKNHRIILVALFGNGESSSPSNTSDFPASLAYEDCVRAQYLLLTKELGINELDVVCGFSMGGQMAYHWAALYPKFVRRAVVICSSARTSKHNYQFLEGPRVALEFGVDYADAKKSMVRKRDGGDNEVGEKEVPRCVQAFGKAYSAWLTSAEWFDEELYKSLGAETLEEWDLQASKEGYVGWEVDDLLALLGMWQRGDISCGGNLEDALTKLEAEVLLMPCETDQYFRPGPNKREAKSLKNAQVAVIPSVWGHIAGGGSNSTDTQWMDNRISEFLNR
ncbi:unnamed protein product [Periconia digitata]|uniref:AB hydrolase-1 domain-containing protein n=1 Tax=Periconia digitata TaxID=1303443 RepID=A0A9W4UFF4_9PLEO|nr:unnamed protein product [Periconia digitata]